MSRAESKSRRKARGSGLLPVTVLVCAMKPPPAEGGNLHFLILKLYLKLLQCTKNLT